jgi:hypothetical protein
MEPEWNREMLYVSNDEMHAFVSSPHSVIDARHKVKLSFSPFLVPSMK